MKKRNPIKNPKPKKLKISFSDAVKTNNPSEYEITIHYPYNHLHQKNHHQNFFNQIINVQMHTLRNNIYFKKVIIKHVF